MYQRTLHQPKEGTEMVFLLHTKVLERVIVVVVAVVLQAPVEAASVALAMAKVVALAVICTGL